MKRPETQLALPGVSLPLLSESKKLFNRMSPIRPKSREWFSLKESDNAAELFIYDAIDSDWGVNAQELVKQIRSLKVDELTVYINSPGGHVFDGFAIYNALAESASNVSVKIDGVAASIASVIALAGNHVAMSENAMMMIHNPWTIIAGDATAFQQAIEVLDDLKNSLISVYCNKSGQTREKISELMDQETWFTSDEASELGLVDEVLEAMPIRNYHDLSAFKNAPGDYSKPTGIHFSSRRDLERLLRNSGVSRADALRISSACDLGQNTDDEEFDLSPELSKELNNTLNTTINNIRSITNDCTSIRNRHPHIPTVIEQ